MDETSYYSVFVPELYMNTSTRTGEHDHCYDPLLEGDLQVKGDL